MITCSKCGKENQDHYKFCLGCGSELPKGTAPKPFKADTPAQGVRQASQPTQAAPQPTMAPSPPAMARAATGAREQHSAPPRVAEAPAAVVEAPPPVQNPPAESPPAQPPGAQPPGAQPPGAQPSGAQASGAQSPSARPSAAGQGACPQCAHPNAPTNRFCAACGYKLSAAPAPAEVAAPAAAPGGVGSVVLTALRADGSEAGSYKLPQPSATVGRDTDSVFAGDSYLSPKHAAFQISGGKVTVRDTSSLNGVYVKLVPNQPWPLEAGSIFRIGQEIIRFEKLERLPASADGVERFGSPAKGFIGRLALVIGRDTTGNAFPIPERGLHLGRERGDVLFSEDGYVSGLHCRVAPGADGRVYLTDVGSSNGTFVRLSGEHQLAPGDILLMGQQVFRVDF